MPLVGRTNFQGTPLVFETINLPYPLYNGEISFSEGMKREPSGSVTYNGITSDQLGILEAAYPIQSRLSFYGCPMEVVSRSWQQTDVVINDEEQLVSYTVTIDLALPAIALLLQAQYGSQWQTAQAALEGEADKIGFIAYSEGLRAKALGSGQTWNFTREQIIETGGNSVSLPSEGYNEATLTWGSDDSNSNSPQVTLTPRRPETRVFEESSEDPRLPPLDSNALRDTSSNFDESGPTKYERFVIRVDGTPDKEDFILYGFAYLMEQIVNDDGLLKAERPEQYWVPVEYKNTQYIYSPVDAATLDVEIRDPSDRNRRLDFVVPPEYDQFVTLTAAGQRVSVKSLTLYNIEVITTGRKLVRLVKETDGRNTLDDTDPRYPLMKFEWIPFYEKKAFLLKPSRGVFVAEDESLPISVEFADYDSLEPRLKARVSGRDATEDGRVAILTPDPEYVEPLYIALDQQQASSYHWALDPDGEIEETEDPDAPPNPPPHFQVGQETDNAVVVTPTDPANQLYSEQRKTYSAQDPQFTSVAEQIVFADMQGQPSSPSVRGRIIEPETARVSGRDSDTTLRYVVTTPDIAERLPAGGSVSVPGAETQAEAIAALEVKLRRSGLQSAQAQYDLAFFYPRLKPGDYVNIEGDRHAELGQWAVEQHSWTQKYSGNNPALGPGGVSITCEKHSLSLGLDQARPVEIQVRSDRGSGSGPTINARAVGSTASLGRVLPPLPNRRNF